MLDVRHLPPFLRIVGSVGLLLAVGSLVTFVAMFVLSITSGDVVRQHLANDYRAFAIALNLGLLSGACSFAVNGHRTRLRQPSQERFPLDAWPRQARAIALLAALPLCAIVLTALLPPTQDVTFLTVMLISLIGAVMLLIAHARLV